MHAIITQRRWCFIWFFTKWRRVRQSKTMRNAFSPSVLNFTWIYSKDWRDLNLQWDRWKVVQRVSHPSISSGLHNCDQFVQVQYNLYCDTCIAQFAFPEKPKAGLLLPLCSALLPFVQPVQGTGTSWYKKKQLTVGKERVLPVPINRRRYNNNKHNCDGEDKPSCQFYQK